MENHLRNGKFFSDRYTDPEQDTYLGLDGNYRYGQVLILKLGGGGKALT